MNRSYLSIVFVFLPWFTGCATSEQVFNVPAPQLGSDSPREVIDETTPDPETSEEPGAQQAGMERLRPLSPAARSIEQEDWSDRFRDDDEQRLAVEDMPLKQVLH
mgnify:FL=1